MNRMIALLLLALVLTGAGVSAQEGMPPMGPPEQMKDVMWMVGTWDAVMNMNMSMDSVPNWVETKGVCTYATILGGAALRMTYTAEMMGMPYEGLGIQTYDRETSLWQMTWTDNMAARTTLYAGTCKDNTTVMTGEDKWNGMTSLARITTFNETPEAFDWKMEMSMDGGTTWVTGGTAVYTKRK